MDWKEKLLTKYVDEFEDCYLFNPPTGWRGLVESLVEYIHWHNMVHGSSTKIYSLEKKHGGLRLVLENKPAAPAAAEEIHGAIHLAETMSCKICEVCGSPASFRKIRQDDRLILGAYCDEHIPEEND